MSRLVIALIIMSVSVPSEGMHAVVVAATIRNNDGFETSVPTAHIVAQRGPHPPGGRHERGARRWILPSA